MDRHATPITLLTGCASGIGRHLTGVLAAQGHQVIATDIDHEGLADAATAEGWAEPSIVTRTLDVRDPQAWTSLVEEIVDRWGHLDVLMNIAGVLTPGYVHETTTEDVDYQLDTNVKGVVHGTRAAARVMRSQGRGHIINIGSLASMAPVPGLGLYSASKFAVRGYSLAAAQELAPVGVAVTLIMPDAVQTPMLEGQRGYEQAALVFSGRRALTVEEVTKVVTKKVLPHRPMEVAIPKSRGILARVATTAPSLAKALVPMLRRRGLARMNRD
jgi:NAD(P)-dependent dehydrogenase (short-subunit alcohol dehydrogenase family)